MYSFPEDKRLVVGPAEAEPNPLRRAVFGVPILRAWLPRPLIDEVHSEA